MTRRSRFLLKLLEAVPLALLVCVFGVFGSLSGRFLDPADRKSVV